MPMWPQGLLHDLAHRHSGARQPGVGTFSFCSRRGSRSAHVSFRPDLEGAGWHRVPVARDATGTLLFERMLACGSPFEAMALLRAHPGVKAPEQDRP